MPLLKTNTMEALQQCSIIPRRILSAALQSLKCDQNESAFAGLLFLSSVLKKVPRFIPVHSHASGHFGTSHGQRYYSSSLSLQSASRFAALSGATAFSCLASRLAAAFLLCIA